MRMPNLLGAAAVTAGLFLLAAPSFAHHSFAAEFDGRNCKDFTGTLTKVDWRNPHIELVVDAKNGDQMESWSLEGPPPSFFRAGLSSPERSPSHST